MANNSTIFLRINDEDVAKLLVFAKQKGKSKLFFNALIFYILNSDEEEVLDFANPIFKNDFEKTLKKIKKKYENHFSYETKKVVEEDSKKNLEKKEETKRIEKENDDFEEDEF